MAPESWSVQLQAVDHAEEAPYRALAGNWTTTGRIGIWSFDAMTGRHQFNGINHGRDFDIVQHTLTEDGVKFTRGDGWSTVVAKGDEALTLWWEREGDAPKRWQRIQDSELDFHLQQLSSESALDFRTPPESRTGKRAFPYFLLAGHWRTVGSPGLWSIDVRTGRHKFDGVYFGEEFDIIACDNEPSGARFTRGDGWSALLDHIVEAKAVVWEKAGHPPCRWERVEEPFKALAGKWQPLGKKGIWLIDPRTGRHTYDGVHYGEDFDIAQVLSEESQGERFVRGDGWSTVVSSNADRLIWKKPGEASMEWIRAPDAEAAPASPAPDAKAGEPGGEDNAFNLLATGAMAAVFLL